MSKSISQLMEELVWTDRFTQEFSDNPLAHKHMAHALTHLCMFVGHLGGQVNAFDHFPEHDDEKQRKRTENALCEIIAACMRIAKTYPGEPIDLGAVLDDHMDRRNSVTSGNG